MTDYAKQEHHEFMQASALALKDDNLQSTLQKLGGTLGQRNQEAFAALEGSDDLRDRARKIKDEALANLDELILQLEANIKKLGGHVHFASDGEEACQIITKLVKEAKPEGTPKVVKSKSMVTEEIHLNKALEKSNIKVVETDLGEFIIQIAEERPSHLVAPALHMRLPQITEMLSKDAGESLPQDPEQLTQYARAALREHFKTADVGISGGNFLVAESGTLCLITNEGNGRLTTAIPPIHIAVVGIEKIIPKVEDLPVFLKVLARAATGQKLSVYTNIITGPRQKGELDGPKEFHLVLLDNGRSDILSGPLRESLFCIRCGACLNACPIYRNIGGHAYGGVYAGPIGAVLTPLYDGLAVNEHLPQVSSLCGACEGACPVRIQIPEMLIQLRGKLLENGKTSSWLEGVAYKSWAAVMKRPRIYRFATWLGAKTVGRLFRKSGWMRRLPFKLHGWTKHRDFPAPANSRFRDWWSKEGEDQNGS